jgi:tRNA ligase
MAAPKYSLVDSQLIADLHKLSKAKPRLVRSSIYAAPADPSITVRSWKMNEFKYYDVPSPFPTLARGIFSVELPPDEPQANKGNEAPVKYRIVARGYDKFFNIGEVPWTTVRLIRSYILLKLKVLPVVGLA